MYVCVILNNTYAPSIHATPLRMVTGTTNDISQLLYFSFYEPVYYHDNDSPFPSASKECHGRWVGISENVGNFMTFKILTDDTHKIIYCSNLCSAHDPNAWNLRIDQLNTTSPRGKPPECPNSCGTAKLLYFLLERVFKHTDKANINTVEFRLNLWIADSQES
jgi:hypothetical protein